MAKTTYKVLQGSIVQGAIDAFAVTRRNLGLESNEAILVKQIEANIDPIQAKFWYAASAIDLRFSFSIGNDAPSAPLNLDNNTCIYAVNLAHQTASQTGMNTDILMYKYEVPVFLNFIKRGDALFIALDSNGTDKIATVYYRIFYKVVKVPDLELVFSMFS